MKRVKVKRPVCKLCGSTNKLKNESGDNVYGLVMSYMKGIKNVSLVI